MGVEDTLNLYIDESGYIYIGESKYKYFLLSGVVITPKETALASILLNKWKEKHLVDSKRCFHAVDFFEDVKPNYRKEHLSMKRNFDRSVDELIEILSFIDFKAQCVYVNKESLRNKYKIPHPPKRSSLMTNADYQIEKKKYSSNLKSSYAGYIYKPADLALQKIFDFHSSELNKNNNVGNINIESQQQFDSKLVNVFYKYDSKKMIYGNKVIGIRFHTKRSLDAGIELADLVAYVSFQTLRARIVSEINTIPKRSLVKIREIRQSMRDKHRIEIISA